jgi:hypothetical protein
MNERTEDITLKVAKLAAVCCSLAAAIYAAVPISYWTVISIEVKNDPQHRSAKAVPAPAGDRRDQDALVQMHLLAH